MIDIEGENKESESLNVKFIENDSSDFIVQDEGTNIKGDINLLRDMGYNKKLINKVYIYLQPQNIERAIDYMTEIDGIYQHDFFEDHFNENNKDLCFICEKPKKFHLDYIPVEFLNEQNNNALNNANDNIVLEEDNKDIIFDFDDLYDIKDKDEDKIEDKQNKLPLDNTCIVCYEDIKEEERIENSLPCGHLCCINCWTNYFKTLIQDAKVEDIKCVEHECKQIVPEDFILKYIKNNKKLVSKYQKFKLRAEIIKDPNKKQCPKPDCESYLEKSPDTNYVKCKKGHQFCFECLRPPHGKSTCEEVMEKDFLKWKKGRLLKKCPRCKIFTEKNEGCNHMTCSSCKYQWCWLCLGPYTYSHYSSGDCKGFQFAKADNLEEAKKGRKGKYHVFHEQNQHLCCFTMFSIFPCFFHGFDEPFELFNFWERYLCIFIMWFFGFFLFAGVSMANFGDRKINFGYSEPAYFIIGALITFCLFVCFQILFTCLITPFILISLVYPYFIDNILIFLDLNG